MGVSTTKVVLLCIFLFLGMVLPGLLMQPEASLQVWDVLEDDFPINSSPEEKLTFLLNYAILAPSSHNSQPWLFNVSESKIQVFADKSRWLKVADADRREQYISLGCALENLIIAAEHFGYNCSVSYFPGPNDLVATVSLLANSSSPSDSRLFYAITSRQTNRNPYEPQTISKADLETIKSLCSDPDVGIFITDDSAVRRSFLDLVVRRMVFSMPMSIIRASWAAGWAWASWGPRACRPRWLKWRLSSWMWDRSKPKRTLI